MNVYISDKQTGEAYDPMPPVGHGDGRAKQLTPRYFDIAKPDTYTEKQARGLAVQLANAAAKGGAMAVLETLLKEEVIRVPSLEAAT